VPDGLHEVAVDFQPTGSANPGQGRGTPAKAQLFIDGQQTGEGNLPTTVPLAFGLGGGLTVGRNPASPVSHDYESPFPFTGIIHEVVIDVSGEHIEDKEAEARAVLARQ
jgi:hypothetical protein